MNLKLINASIQHKEVITNLMQFYMYDFSEYLKTDVENDGLFVPYNLQDYWEKEALKFPYLVLKNEKYAGFMLVRFIKSEQRNYFSIAEFFVMRKYRREGIGKFAAAQIFNVHKGQWEVRQKESNKPAQLFWTRVIDGYTEGRFTDRFEGGRRIQDFEN